TQFYDGDIEKVIGGSGNDRIVGSDAKNLLIGNGGNDTLDGGTANDAGDTLNGGAGTDVAANSAGDTLIGIESTNDPGDAYIASSDVEHELFVIGTANADTITVANGADPGVITVKINATQFAFSTDEVEAIELHANAGNDKVTISTADKFSIVYGDAGN